MHALRPSTIALGALTGDGGVTFRLWAPTAESAALHLEGHAPKPMEPAKGGYFELTTRAQPGTRYRLQAGDEPRPDPASRFQPDGVHGASQVVDPTAYRWRTEDWRGRQQRELVFYELHVGTFTPAGTFAAAAERLPYLAELGVTAVELMPVADFAGRWNWGYDHAALYAPSRAYGTPDALRAFVDQAHRLGLAVFLDVIYNHFGPDGAYAAAFAPFHTDKHTTPWGSAMNLDDEHAAGVRNFFIDNALHWLREYRVDGLRLDAVHALVDDSPTHFLAELSDAVAALPGPPRYLIGEDERNLRTLIEPTSRGGMGLHGVWADDFHHQVRHVVAGDRQGYYRDFEGTTTSELATTLRQGWFFSGQTSRNRGEARGTDPSGLAPEQFVVCIQNHDQVGNRPTGSRLHHEVELSLYRAASALLLFAPQMPLLFMGQEWATTAPFLFFTDHNPELGALVTEGRRREFEDFEGFGGDVPDPQAPETFERSRLPWQEQEFAPHAGILALYRDLLALRAKLTGSLETRAVGDRGLIVRRGAHSLYLALGPDVTLPMRTRDTLLLHTEELRYAAPSEPPVFDAGDVHFKVAGAAITHQAD